MIEKTYSFDHGGKTIDVYTLKNSSGMEMDVCTYGGRILRLTAPDRNGRMGDVIMGFKRPEDYVKNHAYYGAFIGRYGNRIGGACFTLNGVTYKLYPNNGRNTLHGGKEGFDVKVMFGRGQGRQACARISFAGRRGGLSRQPRYKGQLFPYRR